MTGCLIDFVYMHSTLFMAKILETQGILVWHWQ